MLLMADSRRLVEKMIERDPVIKKGLQREIINSRALARFIQKTDGIDSTLDSILGVIRRYPLASERVAGTDQILRDCELTMRNRIGDLAVEHGSHVMQQIAEFAGSVKSTGGENLRVVVGQRSIRVIAEQKALEKLRENFQEREIVRYSDNLVEISLLLTPRAEQTRGIYARITSELALNDVNLVGIMCCSPESILLVEEKDAPKAIETLQEMISERSPNRANRASTEARRSRAEPMIKRSI
jgi:predicted regulator of amino acid metabolism with ACT domain